MAYVFHVATETGHEGHELITLVVGVLLWGVGLMAIALSALALAGRMRQGQMGLAGYAPTLAATFSGASAAIHFTVIGDHFTEAPPEGIFFAAVAWFQLAWAMLVLRRWTADVLLVGVVTNLAIIFVWLWSRTVGLPGGSAVPMGGLDLLATLLELGVVAVAAIALAERGRPRLTDRLALPFSSAVLLSWAALLTVALVTSAAIAMGGHHDAQ